MFLSFSSLPCFCTFYSSIPTRNEVFFRNFSPLISVLFGGFLNQLSKYNSFHLQIRYHTADDVLIASNEIASGLLLTSEHDITLPTNAFIAIDERVLCWSGDEHVWRWRRARFALETNKLKTYVRTPATHTQLATSDFQTELLSR